MYAGWIAHLGQLGPVAASGRRGGLSAGCVFDVGKSELQGLLELVDTSGQGRGVGAGRVNRRHGRLRWGV